MAQLTETEHYYASLARQMARERDERFKQLKKAEADGDRLRVALRNVRDELSNGATANWEFIDRQWEALDA